MEMLSEVLDVDNLEKEECLCLLSKTRPNKLVKSLARGNVLQNVPLNVFEVNR